MGNEDGSEDRLTKNEFAELIQHLSVQDILTIEYRIGTVWNKLFVRKNAPAPNFFCNLCALETSSFKNLLGHIDGKKHKQQMEKVTQLYQQDYTYPKNHKFDTSVDEKNSESVEENNETCLAAEKQTDDDQNAGLKSSTDIDDQHTVGECDKAEEDNEAMQKKLLQNQIKTEHPEANKNVEADNVNSDLKVSAESNDKETIVEKPKIVINPAAAIHLRANSTKTHESEETSKKPEYQTDKIIIPTAHKKKSNGNGKRSQESGSQMQDEVAPKFALKSYSSKPVDNDVHGILGVEYVIKILKHRNDMSPRYECGLCELVLDGFAMQRHLEGYNHRLKFCEKHFPTAIRQYRQYMQSVPEPEIFKVMAPVLAKLAQGIEQHHGRNLPYECYERDFSLNRHDILAKAFSCRHASEQYGPTFTHVVSSQEIDDFINNRHKYLPPPFSRSTIFDARPDSSNNKYPNRYQNLKSDDREANSRDRHRHAGREHNYSDGSSTGRTYMSSGLHDDMYAPYKSHVQPDDRTDVQPVDDETYKLMVDDFLKGTLRGGSRKTTIHSTRKRPASPLVQNSSSEKRKSLSPLRQDDIWQAYRHLVDQELYNLEERFKLYRKEPESHPSYNDEWQKFWKRRKDELVAAGLDHRNYNYQPEWVRFVKIRIEELYGQEIENIKIKSRERLCLPMSNDKITDPKYHVNSLQTSLPNEQMATEYATQQNVATVCSNNASQARTSNAPQVVPVLRLMTALEDSLGSLGPKIIDLLSKALQTEKTNPLHVNAIILNDENCSLIETAKEKFKGLIITGLFEGSKKKVLKQVVADAEALLQYAYQFRKELSSQRASAETSIGQSHNNALAFDNISLNVSSLLKNQSSLNDNSLPRVDKKEIASKLAASLVAQGKTDFDPTQLQQIIAVYKLIEKKKRETAGATLPSNKSYLQDSASTSKKTLSDTLSDLLKPSSSSAVNATSDARNISNRSSNATATSNAGLCSANPGIFANSAASNSFTSVVQNPRDNFFNSTARSMPNTYGAHNVGGNLIGQPSDQAKNYIHNSQPPHPQNFNNMYSNQFQNNNRMAQNLGWNSHMNANQNYHMANPNNSNNNNSLNRNSHWQHF